MRIKLTGMAAVALAVLTLGNALWAADPAPTTITVPDMHCMGCAKKMATELYKVPGVGQVLVSAASMSVTVSVSVPASMPMSAPVSVPVSVSVSAPALGPVPLTGLPSLLATSAHGQAPASRSLGASPVQRMVLSRAALAISSRYQRRSQH